VCHHQCVTQRPAHIDDQGVARMVDIGDRPEGERTAIAEGVVRCSAEALSAITAGAGPKGEVLGTARIAGTHVAVDFDPDATLPGIRIRAGATCIGRTGVEMEALTAVTVAALTLIDMVKSIDRWMTVESVGLVFKSGGKGGTVSRGSSAGS
jgi:cyclic pyranopterin phosphate synthase